MSRIKIKGRAGVDIVKFRVCLVPSKGNFYFVSVLIQPSLL